MLLSSLVMIALPTVLFFCLYGLIFCSAQSDRTDYSEDILGTWIGIQYYQGGEKTVCGDSRPVTVTFTESTLAILSEDFPLDTTPYSWRGRSLVFSVNGTETAAAVSFDSQNSLKLSVQDWDLTLTLRQAQTEGS